MPTVLRWIACCLLAVVLLVAVAYVTIGLRGAGELADAKQHAVTDIASALPEARSQADRVRAVVLDAAVPGREPAYQWTELVCSIGDDEGGLMVIDYYQECAVRTVDLVPTARPTAGPSAHGMCATADAPAVDPALGQHVVRVATGSARALVAAAAADPSVGATPSCPVGIVAPALPGGTRMLAGTRPEHLADPSRRSVWTVVIIDTPLSHSTLGCDPWRLVFCSAPVERPVLGDAGLVG